jgi:hypothetical protein
MRDRDRQGRFTSDVGIELQASVISVDSPWDKPTPFFLEVITDPDHGTAMLRCGIAGKVGLYGPFTPEDLLYSARVLKQAARNIDPDAKLVVIE